MFPWNNKSAKCLLSNSVSERKYNDFTVANKKKLRSKEKKKSKNMENTINNISQSDRKPSHEASQILPLRSLSLGGGSSGLRGCPGLAWLPEAVRAVGASGLSNGHDAGSNQVILDALHATQQTLGALSVPTNYNNYFH